VAALPAGWPSIPLHRHDGHLLPPAKPSKIRVASLDSSEPAIDLFQVESAVSYASAHLLFARDETLMAQPFDPDARQLKGDASPLAEHVGTEGSRYVAASASENGTLVYAHDISQAQQQLTWFDRAGTVLGTLGEPAAWVNLSLSPDERRVAVAQRTDNSDNLDIYIIDITRNVTSRLTADPGIDASPVWSPDGTSVVFEGQRSGKFSIRQKPINGTADESLLEGSFALLPTSWSADGRFIAYSQAPSGAPSDIWILPTFGVANRFRSCRPRSSTSRLCSLRMDAGLRTHRAKAVSGRHRSTSTFSRFPSPAGATRFRGAVAAIRSGEPTAKSSCTSARTRP
jgi:WD40-like Beta Propeller Repeat